MLDNLYVPALTVIGKRQPGIEGRVLQIDIPAAVKLISTAARSKVVQAARHHAKLGGEVRRLQGKFLNRLYRRLRFVGNSRIERAARFLPLKQYAESAIGSVYRDIVPSINGGARGHLGER